MQYSPFNTYPIAKLCAVPPYPVRPLKIAAIVMVYNENVFLPLWYKYYGRQLGESNLFVINHSSSDGSTNFIKTNLICLPRTEIDEIERRAFIEKFHAGLLNYYDVVLYTDCDEFIIPRPDLYSSLADYITRHLEAPIIRCAGIDVVQESFEQAPLDFSSSLLTQRPYGHLSHYSCKPLIASRPVQWSAGFHECKENSFFDSTLWLFHMKLADVEYALQRLALTRSLTWSAKAHEMGHGSSHRIDDDSLRRFIFSLQQNRKEGILDETEFYSQFQSKEKTPLMKIPPMFYTHL
ncbi:glycosyltransferase family 2 protein [Entomobacter blattae]|uniref:Glycosyltransferase family 2 protein n=1 Tax=Entomobacter blattae TaxID=2762277 RepID=A0A7H1NTL7_9PROT|nr:glycosyltransferase family 2 protein [Entomobacter blattae]QNT79127.1 hypothetical protein JGUZn3_19140 [Entomobacter blattae]